MTLMELRALVKSGASPEVEVHAVDPMIYIIYLLVADGRQPVEDGGGRTHLFRSRYAAQQALQEAGFERATFVHRSVYGEMIGMEGSSEQSEFREIVTFVAD